MESNDITDNLNESYNRLKTDLREKYADLIYSAIDKIKNDIAAQAADMFGGELIERISESEEIRDKIEQAKSEYYSGDEYKALQRELARQKDMLGAADASKTEQITKEMRASMDKISTLNITLRNRLKSKYERLYELNDYIIKELDDKKETLEELKNRVLLRIKSEITVYLDQFNDELALLNQTFGKDTDEAEIPFDENAVKLELPIFSYKPPVKSDLEFEADGKQFVLSDSNNVLKN